jgi:hypothetical protein
MLISGGVIQLGPHVLGSILLGRRGRGQRQGRSWFRRSWHLSLGGLVRGDPSGVQTGTLHCTAGGGVRSEMPCEQESLQGVPSLARICPQLPPPPVGWSEARARPLPATRADRIQVYSFLAYTLDVLQKLTSARRRRRQTIHTLAGPRRSLPGGSCSPLLLILDLICRDPGPTQLAHSARHHGQSVENDSFPPCDQVPLFPSY